MNEADDDIGVQASAWHIASFGDAMDWAGFTRWLEADPRHRLAYDEVASADAALVGNRADLASAFAANDDSAEPRTARRPWFGVAMAAVAASLVTAVFVQQLSSGEGEIYSTGAQSRAITLADGSSIELAPRSRLEVTDNGEKITLDGGAWFAIRHDPARALSLRAGALEITDIGTKFDVQTVIGQVRVEVAEGEVSVSSAAMAVPVKLSQGRALAFDPKAGTAILSRSPADNFGEWRSGRLSFDAAPLSLVAADLARYAGVKVTVAENLGGRRFTGTLVIGDGQAALRDLSQLMDLELSRSGGGYRLDSRSR